METVFKDWTIDKCIGEGAFGKVYRIIREDFGHTYEAALKVIEVPQAQSEVDAVRNDGMSEQNVTEYFRSVVEDIVDEFALMSRLKGNSNIVSYEDHSVVPKRDGFGWDIYIRMELLTPLFSHIREHKMTVRDVIQLGIDICHALEVCQKYNIIHRDIKPENIFVSDIGTYKLGDFGIARQLEKTSSGLSKKGTFTYMAPEVYKGLEYNSTVDIYSLGIVLYRFLNGNRSPFMPPAPQPIRYSDKERANIMRISGQRMPKPLNADGRLAEIVLKACAYNPSERYESAASMRQALEGILYSDSESRLIYPKGDMLETKKEEYIIDVTSRGQAKIAKDEEEAKEGTVFLFSNTEKKDDTLSKDRTDSQRTVENQQIPNKEAIRAENSVSEEVSKEEVGAQTVLSQRAEMESTDQTAEKVLAGTVESASDNSSAIKEGRERKKLPQFIFPIAGVALIAIVIIVVVVSGKDAAKQENGKAKDSINTTETMTTGKEKTDTLEKEQQMPEEERTIFVPDFADLSQAEAEKKAEEYRLTVDTTVKYSDTVKKGNVISQEPKKDSEVTLGSSISLIISKGVEKIAVPKVTGKSLSNAKETLKKKHLKYKTKKQYSNGTAAGKVMKQSVKAGKKVEKGTVVVLTISRGKKPAPVAPAPAATPYRDTSSNYQPPASAATKKPVVTRRPVVTKKPAPAKKPKEDDYSDWDLVN